MKNLSAFKPTGPTHKITAAAAPPAAVQISPRTVAEELSDHGNYRIVNAGNENVFLGYAATAALALSNAADIVSSAETLVILPGADEVFSLGTNCYFSAYAV